MFACELETSIIALSDLRMAFTKSQMSKEYQMSAPRDSIREGNELDSVSINRACASIVRGLNLNQSVT